MARASPTSAAGSLPHPLSTCRAAPGTTTIIVLPAFTTDGTRRIWLNFSGKGRANVQALTGHAFTLQAQAYGGAMVNIGEMAPKIYPSQANDDGFTYDWYTVPNAGTVVYSMYAAGVGANGNTIAAGARLFAFDVGAATPSEILANRDQAAPQPAGDEGDDE